MNKSNRQEKKNRRENKVLYGAEISKKENFEKENRESPEKEIFGLWRKGTLVHTGVGGLPFPPRWVLELRTLERTEILHCSVSLHKIGKRKLWTVSSLEKKIIGCLAFLITVKWLKCLSVYAHCW